MSVVSGLVYLVRDLGSHLILSFLPEGYQVVGVERKSIIKCPQLDFPSFCQLNVMMYELVAVLCRPIVSSSVMVSFLVQHIQ